MATRAPCAGGLERGGGRGRGGGSASTQRTHGRKGLDRSPHAARNRNFRAALRENCAVLKIGSATVSQGSGIMQRYERAKSVGWEAAAHPEAKHQPERARALDMRHEEDPELREMGQDMAVRRTLTHAHARHCVTPLDARAALLPRD